MAAVAPARTMFSHNPLDENVELEEDLLADLPVDGLEEPEEQSEPEEFPESDTSTSLSGSNGTESEREQTTSSSSARSENNTSSSLSATTPSQSHSSTLAPTSRPIEDLFEQRPPSPSSSEPPGLVLSLNSNDYILFSLPNSTTSSVSSDVNSGVLFSDKPFLFKAPLQSLMSELQTYFSLENDVTLEFPDLQLSFSTHMIYTQKVTLAHVHLLTQALDRSLPFRAILTEQPNAFLKQYNRLILLAQTGKGAEFRPLSPSASSSDLPVPGSSSPHSVGAELEPSEPAQKPIESSEEEAEFSEQVHVPVPNETIDFEATDNLDANIEEDAGAEDEIEEETIEEVKELSETVTGIDSAIAEEALQEDPTVVSDELEVEIGDINSDLLPPPTDTEPTPALPLKPHSRAFEPDQDDEDAELARKRPRLSPPPEEFDDDAAFAEDL